MIYTESETHFWKYHSMGCGYSGEFKRKPGEIVIYECPECGSEYRPAHELNGELLTFWGDSVDMFSRATEQELIEEMEKRGYKVEKKPAGFWKTEE